MRIARHVRALRPYVPGEQPKDPSAVKLNTNENPYPPSPKVAAALAAFDCAALRKYPDPEFAAIRARLAKIFRTSPERVFVGNGSDEVLTLAARAFVEDGERIASLNPSYSLYRTLADVRGVEWEGVALGADLRVPARFRVSPEASLFLWTNPNAPTSLAVPAPRIAAFARKFPGVVIVDEAYADFASEDCTALAAAPGNRNLLVMRTLSKSFSLAGLRLGYAIGPADLIGALYKVKDSYNVDLIAQTAALAALNDLKWMRASTAKVRRTRRRVTRELERRGWQVPPSETNFLFARPPEPFAAAELFRRLRERNVFVRYFPYPETADRLRITIGTDAEMDAFLRALDFSTREGTGRRR